MVGCAFGGRLGVRITPKQFVPSQHHGRKMENRGNEIGWLMGHYRSARHKSALFYLRVHCLFILVYCWYLYLV